MGSYYFIVVVALFLGGHVVAQQQRMGPSEFYFEQIQNKAFAGNDDELNNAFPTLMAFNWSSIDLKSLKAVSSRCSKDIEQIMGSRLPYARQCKPY